MQGRLVDSANDSESEEEHSKHRKEKRPARDRQREALEAGTVTHARLQASKIVSLFVAHPNLVVRQLITCIYWLAFEYPKVSLQNARSDDTIALDLSSSKIVAFMSHSGRCVLTFHKRHPHSASVVSCWLIELLY